MDFPSQDIIQIILFLLPGFVAAWVFYGLTAHPKQTPFERIIQALIFTAFIQLITLIPKLLHRWVDSKWDILGWNKETEFLWSMPIAILLGLAFTRFANTDWLHEKCRKHKLTQRTSFPSEWFSTFTREATKDREIIIHFKDNRRMLGNAVEWPDRCDSGHFAMTNAQWLLADNTAIDLHLVHRFLIPATDVRFVEIYRLEQEVAASAAQLQEAEQTAIALHEQDDEKETGDPTNGKQRTANTTQREEGHGGEANTANAKTTNITPATPTTQNKVKKQNERPKRKR